MWPGVAVPYSVANFRPAGGCTSTSPLPPDHAGWVRGLGWGGAWFDDSPYGFGALPTAGGTVSIAFTGPDATPYVGVLTFSGFGSLWTGVASGNCQDGDPPMGTRECDVVMDLTSPNAQDYMRNYVDEIDSESGQVTHWNFTATPPLPGFSLEILGASQIWTPGHIRGLIKKRNSVVAGRYEPQTCRLLPG